MNSFSGVPSPDVHIGRGDGNDGKSNAFLGMRPERPVPLGLPRHFYKSFLGFAAASGADLALHTTLDQLLDDLVEGRGNIT